MEKLQGDIVPDKHAYFPGGEKKFKAFINAELQYPELCKINKIEGTVKISFEIDIDGSVQNVQVIESLHSDLDREAIRVVSLSPKWKPYLLYFKPIKSTMNYNIVFKIK
jgi:TonB family protein